MLLRSNLAIVWLLLAAVAASTWAQAKKQPEAKQGGEMNFPPDTYHRYFPKGVFGDDEKGPMKDFTARWYAADLRAMREPSLFEASKNKSMIAYRFLWLRTFHHPIAIRLKILPDGTGFLTGKVTSGAGGYAPGAVTWNKSYEVTESDVQEFLKLLQKAEFWTSPTVVSVGGNDGAEWVVEGVKKGSYHVTDRWSPTNTDYSAMCLFLLSLSKIQVPPKYIY